MNICVFGASSNRLDSVYFEQAKALGLAIAGAGHCLVFGGGASGLMGACAAGAREAGGEVLGIAPRFFDEPGILLKDYGQLIFTDTMSERKAMMEDRAEAFVALPGGIGTYEEFFEVLTLKQLGRHAKPMALLNTAGYFDPMVLMLEKTASSGFMSGSCLELFSLCGSPEEAVEHCARGESSPVRIRHLEEYCR